MCKTDEKLGPRDYMDAVLANDSRSWTVFSVMNAINGALLASLGFSGSKPEWIVIIAFFAAPFCVLWHAMQRRTVSWGRWWEEKLENTPPYDERKDTKHAGLSGKVLIWVVPLLFAVAWIGIALFYMADAYNDSHKIAIFVCGIVSALLLSTLGLSLLSTEKKREEWEDKLRKNGFEPFSDPKKAKWASWIPVLLCFVIVGYLLFVTIL